MAQSPLQPDVAKAKPESVPMSDLSLQDTSPASPHVNLFAEKVGPTPAEYAYEFDCLV